MNGVWLAGLMKPQPTKITASTIDTFRTTMTLLTHADSEIPRINRPERIARITTAGMFMIPVTPSAEVSNGEWYHWYGISIPMNISTRFAYSLQAIATVAAPTAYSSTRSQPITHATSSPIVA